MRIKKFMFDRCLPVERSISYHQRSYFFVFRLMRHLKTETPKFVNNTVTRYWLETFYDFCNNMKILNAIKKWKKNIYKLNILQK